MYTVVCKGVRR